MANSPAARAGAKEDAALFTVRMLLSGALLLATIAVMTVRKLWLYYLILILQQILIVALPLPLRGSPLRMRQSSPLESWRSRSSNLIRAVWP